MSEITVPDTVFNRVLSAVLGLTSACYLVTLLVAMIWRRKHQPVASRSPVLLLFQGFASIGIMTLAMARIAIGRNIFPCPLYAFFWIVVSPSYFTPMFLVAFRVFVLDITNRMKSHVRNMRSSSFPEDEEDHGADQLLTNRQGDEKPSNSSSSSGGKDSPSANTTSQQPKKSRNAERVLSIFRVLGSEKALGFISLAVILFHSLEWLLVLLVSKDLQRLDGCGWSFSMIVCFGISFFFYSSLVFIGALLVIHVRDGFGMWIEYLVCIAFYIVGLAVFSVALFFPAYDTYVEQHFWSSVNFVIVVIVGTNTLRLAVPVVVSVIWQRRKKEAGSSIQLEGKSPAADVESAPNSPPTLEDEFTLVKVLSGKDTLAMFQLFCKREFSSENILCWIDIHKYKKTADSKKRLVVAHNIEDLYIREGGPLAININNELRIQVSNELSCVSPNLFDGTEQYLLLLMSDTFSRFTGSRQYAQLVNKKRGTIPPKSKSIHPRI